MRRLIALASSVFLAVMLCMPTLAAAPEPYIPVIPKFFHVDANGVSFTGQTTMYEPTDSAFVSFMSTLSEYPYLLLVTQEYKNPAKDAAGIDYDRKYWLHFIRFPKSSNSYGVGRFEYVFPNGSNPMRFVFNQSKAPYKMVSYFYDFEQDHLTTSGIIRDVSSPLFFSYVFGSSKLSNPVSYYPNYNTLNGTGLFQVSSAVPGTDRHYNWWLSVNGEVTPPYRPEDNLNQDTNGDGKPDINIDSNGDGKPDINIDSNGDGKPDINIDTDGDGKPDTNIDSNGDGKPDTNLKPDTDIDTDGDGKPDINIDTDGDGKPDINIDSNGDGKPDINIDTDGDGKPDINIDTDGDGKPDINIDSNGDGKPDINIDSNGDGKPDINIDSNGDGKPDINIDTDGDGKPDINIDSNGDGKPDTNIDTDGDGKPDVNVKPDGGGSSSGGSSSGGSSSGGSGGGETAKNFV